MALAVRGRELWQGRQHKVEKISLGNDGASWSVCTAGLTETSVVYSMGVGEEVSFELELIRRFALQVHAFDPTPRSIQWVKKQAIPEKLVFHSFGLGKVDGCCQFSPPVDPTHVSYTMLPRKTGPMIEAPVYRLATIMKILGHSKISLLKMDIEGAEYDVISDVLSSGIRPEQMLVEFHHRWPEIGIEETRNAIEKLNHAGYTIFDVSASGEEYSFQLRA